MNTGGWFVMLISVGSAYGLFAWCLYRVLTMPKRTDAMHSTREHTPDEERPHRATGKEKEPARAAKRPTRN